MSYHDKLRTALKFAALKHAGQVRKGTDVPYLVHPVEVAMVLQSLHCQTDVIVAGFLHDTIEDTDTTFEEIEALFGTRVASVVAEVSEVSKKRAYVKAHTYSPDAIRVKAADLICNVGDLYSDWMRDGDATFTRFAHGKATLDHYEKMIVLLIDRTKLMPVINKALVELLTKLRSML